MKDAGTSLIKTTKKKTWIKFYPEKWLFGSTREEMTNAERAVWWDFLALAALNDPPGQFDFFSYRRLANQLNISIKLLKTAITKALMFRKIELKEKHVGSKLNEKTEEIDPTCDQHDPKSDVLVTIQSKTGITLRTIIILKWNDYQSEYMRQKPHRTGNPEEDQTSSEPDPKLQESEPETVTQVTDRGEERRGEEKRREEKRGEKPNPNNNPPTSPLPSDSTPPLNESGPSKKEEFLGLLKGCKEYPFSEFEDSILFDVTVKEYPKINIIGQTLKKIKWWRDHPDAMKADPRGQLKKWFEKEGAFQKRGGPQQIGELMGGVEDPDHRRFLAGMIKTEKKTERQ